MKKTLLRSQEFTCPSCIAKIEKALKAVDGVADARVYFNTGKIEIIHDPEKVQAPELIEGVKSVGYTASESAF